MNIRLRRIRIKWLCAGVLMALMLWYFGCYTLSFSLDELSYCEVIEDREGSVLSVRIADDDQWRFPPPDSLPSMVKQAILHFEDKRFYIHPGVDPLAVLRATRQNLRAGQIVSGASTLTMQVARMIRHNRPRTFVEKLCEAMLALKLEVAYSKEEILRIYATMAPYGGNIVGIEAAAWRYFKKPLGRLSWSEAATLAVLPNAPGLITFQKNRPALKTKRDALLNTLLKKKVIDSTSFTLALMEALPGTERSFPNYAPHYLSWISALTNSDRVETQIDPELQRRIAQIADRHYDRFAENQIHNTAILVLDTKTAQVLAYLGNIHKSSREPFVDMVQAPRSSGSILKPFLYGLLLTDGYITPSSLTADIPVYMSGFAPSNYDRQYAGAVAADRALTESLNIPFVLLLKQYGIERFRKALLKLHLKTINRSSGDYGLSLILGGGEVTLWDLTHAYSSLARTLSGKTLPDEQPILSKAAIYHTFEAMKQLKRPAEHGAWDHFYSSENVAWKTGTSYGHRDAWAIGVRPDYTVGVWTGNTDGEGRPSLVGLHTAGPVLFDVLESLLLEDPWFSPPYENMTRIEICNESGMLPTVHCLARDTTWMAKTCIRSAVCPFHITAYTDISGQYLIDKTCKGEETIRKKSFFRLPPVMAHYYSLKNPSYASLPPIHPACIDYADRKKTMEFIYPGADERIFIPTDFNDARQSFIARVSHEHRDATIYWYLDGHYTGETKELHTFSFDPSPGQHQITCVDMDGVRIHRKIYVAGTKDDLASQLRAKRQPRQR